MQLHQWMPSILTCMVAKRLSKEPTENHWHLRDYAACTLAFVLNRYGSVYQNMQPRVTRTLLRALMDPQRPLTTHYGALVGFAALGPRVVQLFVVPNIPAYMALLEPQLDPAQQANEMKRYEAERCYGALQGAAGACMHHRLASFFPFGRAVDGGALKRASAPGGDAEAPSKAASKSGAGKERPRVLKKDECAIGGSAPKKKLRVARCERIRGGGDAVGGDNSTTQDKSESAVGVRALEEAWREDSNIGPQLEALGEVLGEGIIPYIPTMLLGQSLC
ncbi:hypothetical protein CYMTET_31890 [Cymbomonas tetramitiformis]|uniref:TAF6 C-terminal HEAT repeat domain-containing protein n=1 Tax=Cymbomonas tetramitiformis TaxID=36881 RepID=A0AAE0KSS3_9CHLO|nr:hypothetical protein CYMTET_31890 [Cymbomonas tetramitiformis]